MYWSGPSSTPLPMAHSPALHSPPPRWAQSGDSSAGRAEGHTARPQTLSPAPQRSKPAPTPRGTKNPAVPLPPGPHSQPAPGTRGWHHHSHRWEAVSVPPGRDEAIAALSCCPDHHLSGTISISSVVPPAAAEPGQRKGHQSRPVCPCSCPSHHQG